MFEIPEWPYSLGAPQAGGLIRSCPEDFVVEEIPRVHPTGPMPGEGGTQPMGEVADMERIVLQNWPELTEVLQALRVQASRRALRLHPAGFEWGFDGDAMQMAFVLPPGTYATTVLREILAERMTGQEA